MKKRSALLMVALMGVIASSASANLLSSSDAGFEDPWPDGAPDWFSQKENGLIERDSTIWGPGPHSGDHYGSLQTGGNADHAAWITINASGPMVLDMYVAGGSLDAAADLFVQLIDGDENGAVLDEWTQNIPTTAGFGWTALPTLTGNATSGQVTVKMGYDILGGWSNGTGIHADSIVLTPEPAALVMLALAGLTVLRRRRT